MMGLGSKVAFCFKFCFVVMSLIVFFWKRKKFENYFGRGKGIIL